MKKMDEIMELLTDEIDGFNTSIKKLEVISENFKDITVKADSTQIEELIRNHLEFEQHILSETHKNIKGATLIPKWILAVFTITLLLIALIIGYFGFHLVKTGDKIDAAYDSGKQEIILEFEDFFESYPDTYKEYQKWSKEKDTIPNHK